jgi:diguanylate cyclase (GGDEF)-like protein
MIRQVELPIYDSARLAGPLARGGGGREAGAGPHLLPLALVGLLVLADLHTEPRGRFGWLYVVVAVLVASSFQRRLVVGAYVALMALSCAAILLDPRAGGEGVEGGPLAIVATMAIAAVLVSHLRERLEAGREAYERLAALDPLTGVGNYRMLHERLAYEIARHERHERRLAVILLDLNRFKDVNEIHGHLEGDRVLREVARALAGAVREQDTVTRQGGDEFAILAPETSTVEVMALAGRIGRELERIPVRPEPVSASIGWAIYPDDGRSADLLLRRADQGLREGKARWLPEETRPYWPEHLRRLRDARPGRADEAGDACA